MQGLSLFILFPHADAQQNAQAHHTGNDGRAAIAEKGQRNPNNRKQADGHADIY